MEVEFEEDAVQYLPKKRRLAIQRKVLKYVSTFGNPGYFEGWWEFTDLLYKPLATVVPAQLRKFGLDSADNIYRKDSVFAQKLLLLLLRLRALGRNGDNYSKYHRLAQYFARLFFAGQDDKVDFGELNKNDLASLKHHKLYRLRLCRYRDIITDVRSVCAELKKFGLDHPRRCVVRQGMEWSKNLVRLLILKSARVDKDTLTGFARWCIANPAKVKFDSVASATGTGFQCIGWCRGPEWRLYVSKFRKEVVGP